MIGPVSILHKVVRETSYPFLIPSCYNRVEKAILYRLSAIIEQACLDPKGSLAMLGMIRQFPLGPRSAAILLMVAGAASFVVSRVLFDGQVLCLLGSTLVVFLGLGLIVALRRSDQNEPGAGRAGGYSSQVPMDDQQRSALPPEQRFRKAPRGLREAARQQASSPPPVETWQEQPAQTAPKTQTYQVTLIDEVVRSLESLGAEVNVETRRIDRGILHINTRDGRVFKSIVREDVEPVDVPEVRSLKALVTSSGADGGYLIAAGSFTEQAYEWASARQLRLVSADELDELSI